MYRMTLQNKLTGCLFLTSMVLICLSLYFLFDAWQGNCKADEVIRLGREADFFLKALKDLTFERGRTNVILSAEKPVSGPDWAVIEKRRKSANENIDRGLVWLTQYDPLSAGKLQKDYDDLIDLRKEIDRVVPVSSAAGRFQFRDAWYKESTGFIHHIIGILDTVGRRQSVSRQVAGYHRLLIDTLKFRDRIGQSASQITAALSRKSPLSGDEYRRFLRHLSQADDVWSEMEAELSVLGNEDLNRQKSTIFNLYYEQYRPVLEETIPLVLAGAAPPEKIKQLRELSVPAFDSVFLLLEQYRNATATEMYAQKKKAFLLLVLAAIQFIVGLTVVFLTVLYFRNRLFRPLGHLIGALKVIRTGESVPGLEMEIKRTDEIGQLAAGVKMLETSMAQERKLRKVTELWATTDELTGLRNRHFLEKNIEPILDRSDRYSETISLIIFDLDHFKQVNDTWGHPAGDAVLRQISGLAEHLIRSSDMLIRFGGEEFLLLMPQTALSGAVAAAEKMRESFEQNVHPGVGGVTASFGVAERKKYESFGVWYERTDEALYKAKQYGRNRVVTATEAVPPPAAVHVEWLPEWETGNVRIDEQHRKLVELSNNLIAVSMQPQPEPAKVLLWLNKLSENLMQHFGDEDRILAHMGYPGAEDHAALHQKLLDDTAKLKESYRRGEIKGSVLFFFIVNDVVLEHMRTEDKLFFPYIRQRTSRENVEIKTAADE